MVMTMESGNHASWGGRPVAMTMITTAAHAGTAMRTAQTGSVLISNFIRGSKGWGGAPGNLLIMLRLVRQIIDNGADYDIDKIE